MTRLPADTDCFRLVDRPDHTIDVFGPVAILSLYRAFRPDEELGLARAIPKVKAVYVKRRPAKAQGAEGVAPALPITGDPIDALEVKEGGATFEIRPANGLSVGLYLDARDARAFVRTHARGRAALNLFAYTCGFGVAALRGGATRAVNIDLSRKVLDWGEKNTVLNGFAAARRDFIAGDCFDWLQRFAKKGERFGLVVVDPPSFSTADGKRFRAEDDYAGLIAAVRPVLAPGALLVACCNLETWAAADFARQVSAGLEGQGATIAAFGASAIDFAQPSALKVVAVAMN